MDGFAFSILDRVSDAVTGFGGVVTARAQHLNLPSQYLIEGIDTTGRPVEWWVSESRLTKVEG